MLCSFDLHWGKSHIDILTTKTSDGHSIAPTSHAAEYTPRVTSLRGVIFGRHFGKPLRALCQRNLRLLEMMSTGRIVKPLGFLSAVSLA
jgi:hypothetical protein